MPRKKKDSIDEKKATFGRYWLPSDATWGGYVNVNLNEAHKMAFDEWFEANDTHVSGMLEDAVAEGMKISFSWDGDSQCFVVALSGDLLPGRGERYVMTSRHVTMTDVVALAMWKWYVLCDERIDDYLPRSGNLRRWG